MQSVSVVQKLSKGDEVLVYNEHGNLRDSSSELFTQFIGILLEDPDIIFHARNERNIRAHTVITYSDVDINRGNGMTRSTGTFTAPASGTYYFQFQGVNSLFGSNRYAGFYIEYGGRFKAASYINKVRLFTCANLHTGRSK